MPTPKRIFTRHSSVFFSIFAVLLSLVLAACGSSPATSSSSSTPVATVAAPTGLIQSGQLLVGSDTTYPPMDFIDATTNQFQGFDIDLITAIAQRMGLHEQTKQTSFDTIFNDLDNKRFDIVISAVTINAQREQKFQFVPYFNAGESLLVPKGDPKHLTSIADLCGLNVGVQNGTTEQADLVTQQTACKKAGKGTINMTVLTNQTDVIQLLANGRVDATYQDSPVTDYYNKLNPGRFEVGGSIVNAAPYGIVIRKGNTSLFNAVTAALKAMKADGTYNSLFNKWDFSAAEKG